VARTDDRKMPATVEAVDLEDDRITGLPLDVDLWFRARRSTRPAIARLQAWPFVGSRPGK